MRLKVLLAVTKCGFWPAILLFGVFVRAGSAQLPEELFRLDKVWDVELTFPRDQWRALQPNEQPGVGFFGGGPGGRPGGGPRFGMGMFLGPPSFNAADTDGNGRVTRAELEKLGQTWFDTWDKDKTGKLDDTKLKSGLDQVLAGPSNGGISGGPPRGFSLQGQDGKRNGLSSMRGLEFNYVHADLKFEGQSFRDVAVRYKGNGTYMQSASELKRPLKLDLNEFVKGQKLAGVSKLNFHNNVTDASWMNEALAYRLYRDAGVPAPRVGYARLRLNVPQEHTNTILGLYTLVENVDSNFAEDVLDSKKGLLLKPSTPQLFKYLGEDWEAYKQTYDPKTPVYASQARRVIDFCKLLTDADDATFAAQAPDFVDFDEISRFLAVTVWISTLDSILGMGQNFVVHLHPKTKKLQLMPWDLDHAFGQFGMRGSQEEREQLSIREAWNPEVRFLYRLMKIPAFEQAYLDRLREFQGSLFKPERLSRQVDELAAVIRESVKLDGEEKLARFDRVVSGEPVPMMGFGGGGPGAPRPEGARPSESARPEGARNGGPRPIVGGRGFGGLPPKPIKGFVPARYDSVAAQLAGNSQGKKLSTGFDPARMVAGRFMEVVDSNQDRALNRTEFVGKFGTWFTEWDKDKVGAINEETLKNGLSDAFMPRPE